MWKSYLTTAEAWTYYYACYLPSIGYPLSCSLLTYAQLDRVQRTALSIIVAKCGFNRNTKREILYGPQAYGGANFRHLYMHQGVGQITIFMSHWRQTQTIPGKLLRCAVAWNQMTAGTSYYIFQRAYENLPHLESKWLTSMRTFMAQINAEFELDASGVPPISDISDATGLHLDLTKQQGSPSDRRSATTRVQVRQDRPSEDEWKLWRRTNQLWSSQDGVLHRPLGEWLHPLPRQRQPFRLPSTSTPIHTRRDHHLPGMQAN
jgi:hypothetical protein